jgi:hypothetical protein
MGKKHRERLHQRLEETVTRLTPTLGRDEVTDLLGAAGCDTGQLRERLHQLSQSIANAGYAKGRTAPDYLLQVIDLTRPPGDLPRDPKHALTKARQWLTAYTKPPSVNLANVQIARLYRKSGNLSTNDEQLIDALEEKLRKKLTEGS